MFLSHKLSYCVLLLSVFSKFFIYTIEASPLYFAKSEIQNVTETLEAGIPDSKSGSEVGNVIGIINRNSQIQNILADVMKNPHAAAAAAVVDFGNNPEEIPKVTVYNIKDPKSVASFQQKLSLEPQQSLQTVPIGVLPYVSLSNPDNHDLLGLQTMEQTTQSEIWLELNNVLSGDIPKAEPDSLLKETESKKPASAPANDVQPVRTISSNNQMPSAAAAAAAIGNLHLMSHVAVPESQFQQKHKIVSHQEVIDIMPDDMKQDALLYDLMMHKSPDMINVDQLKFGNSFDYYAQTSMEEQNQGVDNPFEMMF